MQAAPVPAAPWNPENPNRITAALRTRRGRPQAPALRGARGRRAVGVGVVHEAAAQLLLLLLLRRVRGRSARRRGRRRLGPPRGRRLLARALHLRGESHQTPWKPPTPPCSSALQLLTGEAPAKDLGLTALRWFHHEGCSKHSQHRRRAEGVGSWKDIRPPPSILDTAGCVISFMTLLLLPMCRTWLCLLQPPR